MSHCSLGMGSTPVICKYGIDHLETMCGFCDLEKQVCNIAVLCNELAVVGGHFGSHLERIENQDKQGHAWHSGQIKALDERINNLEKLFHDELHRLKTSDKKPFKCPVCDGNGWIMLKEPLVQESHARFSISCVSCNEKGIIWG